MLGRSLNEHLHRLPLFPLPGVVLFPSMRLPLHIFEPRYRQMVQDARSLGLPIAMGNMRENTLTAMGQSAVYPTLGVGFIDQVRDLPDGRFLIELVGEARVRLLRELETDRPYRMIAAGLLPDDPAPTEQAALAIAALRRTIVAIHQRDPRGATALSQAISDKTEAGHIADAIAGVVQTEPELRQTWLNELNAMNRLNAVTRGLQELLGAHEPTARAMN